MLRNVKLYGNLKQLYPDEIRMDVSSVAETIRALSFQVEGFRDALQDGHYRVVLGSLNPANDIGEEAIGMRLGTIETIHIMPVLEGSKRGGLGKIIAGVALIALSFALPGSGAIAGAGLWGGLTASTGLSALAVNIGVSMALGGVAALITPQVKPPNNSAASFERPEERPSFLYNGPVNTTEQGGPVPIAYGEIRIGSQVISTGLTTEKRAV